MKQLFRYIPEILINYSSFVLLFPLYFVLVDFKRFPPVLESLSYYLITASITELVATGLWFFSINNLPLLHIYTPLELALLTWFYRHLLPPHLNKWAKRIVVGFIALAFINACWFQSIFSFNTYARSLEALIVISYSLVFFFKEISDPGGEVIFRKPAFWINGGFLLYFSGNLILFLGSNSILSFGPAFNELVWALHAVFYIFLYLFIGTGLWMFHRK